MTFIQKIGYFFITLLGLILLAFLDYFVLYNVLDMISTSWLVHTIVFGLMILFINPLIIYYLTDLIPFKKKKKIKKNINKIPNKID